MFDYKNMWSGLATDDINKAKVCIFGIPFDGGASFGKGAALAPQKIRLLTADEMPGSTEDKTILRDELIYDAGDARINLNWEDSFQAVEDKSLELMKSENFCLFIGGDHSVTIPLQRAFGNYQRKQNNRKIGVVHLDAHPDLCHNFHGHKWSHANTEARALEDVISPADLCFAGIRAFEEEELTILDNNPEITVYTANDIYQDGIVSVFEKIEAQFKSHDALYLTLDIDVLDPAFAPGTGTPVSGGLNSRELLTLIRCIIKKLPVRAMDIVEVSPPLDVNDITSWAAIRVIHEVLGQYST